MAENKQKRFFSRMEETEAENEMCVFGLRNILLGKCFLLCGFGCKGKINTFVLRDPLRPSLGASWAPGLLGQQQGEGKWSEKLQSRATAPGLCGDRTRNFSK